jgi:hypothetical protein
MPLFLTTLLLLIPITFASLVLARLGLVLTRGPVVGVLLLTIRSESIPTVDPSPRC